MTIHNRLIRGANVTRNSKYARVKALPGQYIIIHMSHIMQDMYNIRVLHNIQTKLMCLGLSVISEVFHLFKMAQTY